MSRLDPNIPLQARGMQVDIGAAQRQAMSLRDMAQQRQLRQQQIQQSQLNIEEDQRKKSLETQNAQYEQIGQQIVQKHTKLNDNGELEWDDKGILADMASAGLPPSMLDYWQKESQNHLTAARQALKDRRDLEKADTEDLMREAESVLESKNQQKYAKLRKKIVSADPNAQLPPMFDEASVKSIISDANLHLTTQEDRDKQRKAKADADKSELDLGQKKQTKDEVAVSLGYKDFSSAPRFIQDKINKEKTGIDTTAPKEDQWEVENKIVYDAYASKIGKDPSKLTSQDRLDAKDWRQKMKPVEATDFDKRLSLLRKDEDLYNKLYGRGDKDITSKDKIQARQRVMASIATMRRSGSSPEEIQAAWDEEKGFYDDLGIDIGTMESASATPAPAAVVPNRGPVAPAVVLPKPGKAGESPSDDVITAYLKAAKGDPAAATKALKAAGWR